MFSTTSIISFLLLAVRVAASPVVVRESILSLDINKLFNLADVKNLNIAKIDQARAKGIIATGTAIETGICPPGEVASVGATNIGVSYVANFSVGIPSKTYSLVIDTGSSNTWVGAQAPYVKTITAEETGQNVSVIYGSGAFNGTEFIDTVKLSPDLVIFRQSIGAASNSTGFDGVDGILGIGPVDLTNHTLSPDRNATIPTVTDNLYSQGTIKDNIVAVSFAPTNTQPNTNGKLTFGGTDHSKYTGEITYVPPTKTPNAKFYWGIDQAITYGSNGTSILKTTAGIVDTGTTLFLIATDAFERYKSVTGGVPDNTTGLLKITSAQYSNLQSLFLTVEGGRSFDVNANAQIWPRSLNSVIGGDSDGIYLVVADIGTPSGSGLDFIVGQVVLERFYAVFNSATRAVGLATTPYTFATTN